MLRTILVPDSTGATVPLSSLVTTWLHGSYNLTGITRDKGDGYKADSLNKELRNRMSTYASVFKGETYIEDGCFLHAANKGFDFAMYDEIYNLQHLRNVYIGSKGRLEGAKRLEELYKQFNMDKKNWIAKITPYLDKPMHDIKESQNVLTVVGELQFGNWALVNHDLLRLMNASNEVTISLYIYITSTGDLTNKLSDNIVTFNKFKNTFEENKSIIKTPIWLIGLDEA